MAKVAATQVPVAAFLVATVETVEVAWVAIAGALIVVHVIALRDALSARSDLYAAVRAGLVHRGARGLIAAGAIRTEFAKLLVQISFLLVGIAQFYRPETPAGAPEGFGILRAATLVLFFGAQLAIATDSLLALRDRRRLVDYYAKEGRLTLVKLAEQRRKGNG